MRMKLEEEEEEEGSIAGSASPSATIHTTLCTHTQLPTLPRYFYVIWVTLPLHMSCYSATMHLGTLVKATGSINVINRAGAGRGAPMQSSMVGSQADCSQSERPPLHAGP